MPRSTVRSITTRSTSTQRQGRPETGGGGDPGGRGGRLPAGGGGEPACPAEGEVQGGGGPGEGGESDGQPAGAHLAPPPQRVRQGPRPPPLQVGP